MESSSPASSLPSEASSPPPETSTAPVPAPTTSIFNNILFRNVCPTDLAAIYNIERSSYPKDEAASKSQIQYRQHHAAPFFRCAVYIPPDEQESSHLLRNTIINRESNQYEANNNSSSNSNVSTDNNQHSNSPTKASSLPLNASLNNADASRNSLNAIGTIIGFICATRCHEFTEKSMKTHDPSGTLLAIHSVVIDSKYRNMGIGKAMMLNYIQAIESSMEMKLAKPRSGRKIDAPMNHHHHHHHGKEKKNSANNYIQKMVLMSKISNIPFYVKLGFQVLGQSDIVHGEDPWYDCMKPLVNVEKFHKLQQQQQLMNQQRKNGSLCWIVDSFATPVYGRRTHSSGTESGTGNSLTTSSSLTKEGSVSTINTTGGGASTSSGAISITSYQKGSGNPAAVVMVPNATPMSKFRRVSSSSQIQAVNGSGPGGNANPDLSGTTAAAATATSSNSNNANNFDPMFEDNISWMKLVAKEFNLSETAFIWKDKINNTPPAPVRSISPKLPTLSTGSLFVPTTPSNNNGGKLHYNIRYYTCNGTEVDLCGHATLAAASAIFQQLAKEGINKSSTSIEEITFHAKNNVILKAKPGNANNISARISGSGVATIGGSSSLGRLANHQTMKLVMEFPAKEVLPFEKGTEEYKKAVWMLKEAFYTDIDDSTIESYVEFIGVDDGQDDLLIELTPEGFSNVPRYSEDINFKPIIEFGEYNRGVIVCCEVSDEYHLYGETTDFMSRFFGPKVGIEEDPVTGSAHCVLGPYFGTKLGKTSIVGAQKSLRGGHVECQIKDDGRIQIAGTAVTTMNGNLYI